MSEEELFSSINIALTRINNSTSIRNETYIDKEVLQGILDYIDKLQKENEKLNTENINLKRNQIIDKSSIPNQENFYDYYNFISKGKIRDKLAYLEAALEGYYEAELEVNNTHETKILEEWKQWLEELLEEE